MTTPKKVNYPEIVERAAAKLNATDKEKIANFYALEAESIVQLEEDRVHNATTDKLEYTREVKKLERKIEDAETNIGAALTSVDVASLATNADCEAYAPGFWAKVNGYEQELTRLVAELAEKKELYASKVAATKVISERAAKYLNILTKVTKPKRKKALTPAEKPAAKELADKKKEEEKTEE